MTTATSPVVSTGLNAKADPEVKKVGFGANGHEALDLAETVRVAQSWNCGDGRGHERERVLMAGRGIAASRRRECTHDDQDSV